MHAPAEARLDPRLVRRFRRFARAAAWFTLASALVVLAGWALELRVMQSLLPGHVSMKVNSALGLAALALALLACRPERRRWLVTGLLSLLALAIGAATLAQYAWGLDLGIDLALRPDPDALPGTAPGRMSQLSALCLLAMGGLGLAVCTGRSVLLEQGLALLCIGITLFALSAYGYLLGSPPGQAPLVPMAVPTALLFLLLALGWLAARPEQGMMRVLTAHSFGGTLARRALLPSLLIPSLLGYLGQLMQSRGWLSPEATVILLAVASGGLVAWLVWSVSALLDRVEHQRRIARALRHDASTDALTGLGNRRVFQDAIDGLLRRRRDEDAVFSMLILDLDRFKDYNDTFGHLAGDEALRIVGRLLQAALRPGDVAVRYGGEEFTVLLPGIPAERGLRVAERIRRDFHTAHWPHRAVTASLGVAEAVPGEDADHLVARADQALYAAKQGGRDRVCVAPAEPPATASEAGLNAAG